MLLLAGFNLARMNLLSDGKFILWGYPLKRHYAREDERFSS